MKRLLSVVALAGVLGSTSEALAAPAPACTPASMLPQATTIPVNLPGFAYNALHPTAADVHLFTMQSGVKGTEVPLTVGSVPENGFTKVQAGATLTVGANYQLEFQSFCTYGPVPPQAPLTFTAAAAAPLPTQLGTVVGTPTVTLQDFGSTELTLNATYTFADEMKPWAAVYEILAVIDGKLLDTRPVLTATGAQISATGWCDAATAATQTHAVSLRGRLPFAPTVETPPTSMTFDCPAPKFGTPGSSNPTAPPGSSGSSGGTGSGSGSSASSGTSSCTMGRGASSSLPFAFAGVALGVAALVRRRRVAR